MTSVGLSELRHEAAALIRRVESGEKIAITVAGRVAARLVPITSSPWRRWGDVASIFDGPAHPDLEIDRDLVEVLEASDRKSTRLNSSH